MRRTGPAERTPRGALPPAAAALVDRSITASGLPRREAEEVALELSAHFEDALEKGRNLEELMRDFGSPALAGPLIGRSVRRRRRGDRALWHLAEAVTGLVLAAYLVSFARLHASGPEFSAGPDSGAATRAALAAWSEPEPPLDAQLLRARSGLAAARLDAVRGNGHEAVRALSDAIETARGLSDGPSPADDLAALRLAGEAAAAAADIPAAHPDAFTASDRRRLEARLAALRANPIGWRADKVRSAFRELASWMYTPGDAGRLTARGLRLYQAWKGKTRPGPAALLLEPAYFPNPARRRDAVAELERFLALAGSGHNGQAFEQERRSFEASPWRALRYAPLQIPLDHLTAARETSRALARALERRS